MGIGKRIRIARKSAGLSQEALAWQAGMSLRALNSLERGESTDPHWSTLSGIAKALDISVAELMGEPVPAGKADAPGYAGRKPEDKVVDSLRGWRGFLDAAEKYLRDAMERDAMDLGTAIAADQVEQDIWNYVVPALGLGRGIAAMSKEERTEHELLLSTLDGYGSTVDEAYKASSKKLDDTTGGVVDFEQRDRARAELRKAAGDLAAGA